MSAVYVLLDPRVEGSFVYGAFAFDYEPFYVGKAKDVKTRITAHFNGEGVGGKKASRIEDICIATQHWPPHLIICSGLTDSEACKKERRLIRIMGRNDLGLGPLLNLTDGGEGVHGRIMDNEERAARSKSLRASHARCKNLTPEIHSQTYTKISETWANKSREEVDRIVAKWRATKELKSDTARALETENRRVAAIRGNAKRTPQERSATMRKVAQDMLESGAMAARSEKSRITNRREAKRRHLDLIASYDGNFRYLSGYAGSRTRGRYRCGAHGVVELMPEIINSSIRKGLAPCKFCNIDAANISKRKRV